MGALERAENAVAWVLLSKPPRDTVTTADLCDESRVLAKDIARAVLKAVRDEVDTGILSGDNAVISAGAEFCANHPTADAEHIASTSFLAMIDAILAEPAAK